MYFVFVRPLLPRESCPRSIPASYGAASFIQILAPELTDRMLADFLDLENGMVVTLHIQSIDLPVS